MVAVCPYPASAIGSMAGFKIELKPIGLPARALRDQMVVMPLRIQEEITQILQQIDVGDPATPERLFPLIYEELHSRARAMMAGERRDHTLQATALVHEAFLKVARPGVSFQSRLHFYNAAALAMRRILVDHAAANAAEKRGGGAVGLSLSDVDPAGELPDTDVLALDEALKTLETRSPRQHQVVMLRFFGGLKDAEIAEMLSISDKTVRRDWATAKIWLAAEMEK